MDNRARALQAKALKALAHPTRIAMLDMMRDGEVCVCEMGPQLGLAQANVSQHLAILRDSHLVATRRDSTRVMYRVTDSRVFDLLDMVAAIAHDQFDEAVQALASLHENNA